VELIGTPRAADLRESKRLPELEFDLDLGRPLALRCRTRRERPAAEQHVDEINKPVGYHLDCVGVEHRRDTFPATPGEVPELRYEDLPDRLS
jgi:hypothetical protein